MWVRTRSSGPGLDGRGVCCFTTGPAQRVAGRYAGRQPAHPPGGRVHRLRRGRVSGRVHQRISVRGSKPRVCGHRPAALCHRSCRRRATAFPTGSSALSIPLRQSSSATRASGVGRTGVPAREGASGSKECYKDSRQTGFVVGQAHLTRFDTQTRGRRVR